MVGHLPEIAAAYPANGAADLLSQATVYAHTRPPLLMLEAAHASPSLLQRHHRYGHAGTVLEGRADASCLSFCPHCRRRTNAFFYVLAHTVLPP